MQKKEQIIQDTRQPRTHKHTTQATLNTQTYDTQTHNPRQYSTHIYTTSGNIQPHATLNIQTQHKHTIPSNIQHIYRTPCNIQPLATLSTQTHNPKQQYSRCNQNKPKQDSKKTKPSGITPPAAPALTLAPSRPPQTAVHRGRSGPVILLGGDNPAAFLRSEDFPDKRRSSWEKIGSPADCEILWGSND